MFFSRIKLNFFQTRTLSRNTSRALPFSADFLEIGSFIRTSDVLLALSGVSNALSRLSSGRTSHYKTVAKYPNLLCAENLISRIRTASVLVPFIWTSKMERKSSLKERKNRARRIRQHMTLED